MMIIPKAVTISIVVALLAYLVVYVIFYAGLPHFKKEPIRVPQYSKYYAPFVIYVTLSTLWTVNPDYSFPLIRIFLCFEFGTLVCFVSKKEDDIKNILKGLILGAIISSIVVVYHQYQYIGIMRLGNHIYGSAMEFSGGITIAAYCCLFLWKVENKKKYLALFVLFLAICALSGSRSALVYPFLFFFLMNVFYFQKITKTIKTIMVLGGIGIVVLVACLKIPVFYNVVGHRIETLLEDKTKDGSYMERKEMKEYAIKLWKEKPIIGWGCNGFSKKYALINKPVYSHCDYTEILSCFGLIGATLFYFPIIIMLSRKNILQAMKLDWLQSFLGAVTLFTIIAITHSTVFLNVKAMMLLAIAFEFLKKKRYG